jgi:hypothetical protein
MKQSDIGLGEVEKRPLKELLKHRYEVPHFQREYSWVKDHWTDFYEDLKNSSENNRGHFFGFMTFKEIKREEYEIIEGQQRLTTVTVFLSVVRDICDELALESLKNEINTYIFLKEAFKDEQHPNLCLSDFNKKFFRDYIQESGTLSNKQSKYKTSAYNKSNKAIWSCYKYFYGELFKEITGLELKKKNDFLKKYCIALIDNFIVIVAYVEDAIAAYNIFQTINDRGQDLALSDILKIHLCQLVHTAGKDASEFIKEYWDDIRMQLVKGNMNNFLRHNWLSTKSVVKETQLLNELKKHISDTDKAYEFLEKLSAEVGTYEALNNPTKDNWSNWSNQDDIITELSNLQNVSPTIPIALLMAAAEVFKENEKEFIKIIKYCTNFLFRYLTIAEQESKALEKVFSDLAINLRSKKINSSQIREELLKNDIKDEVLLRCDVNSGHQSAHAASLFS